MNRLRSFLRLRAVRAGIGWRDHGIGALLALAYVVWLLATARSLGFPRDEGFYFHAARDYARWFELLLTRPHDAMQRGAIDAAWATNHEHPSLMKSLFALSWMAFHEKWAVFHDASDAFRLPGMAMAGIALWVTYLFGARAYGRSAGLAAAFLLALMPRVFFHAHLACFDIGIMTMWTWCVYVYYRTLSGRWPWVVALGIFYGFTLDTKHNAWILPAVFLSHAAIVLGASVVQRKGANPGVSRTKVLAALLSMATLGPVVFYGLWPWIWNDTFPRLQEYANFHLHHEYYNIEFLGKNYFSAPSPRAYAPVMIAATVPTITLVLFGTGLFDRLKHSLGRLRLWFTDRQGEGSAPWDISTADLLETDALLALALAAPLAPFFLPNTPIFGGTKHWLPAYPFLAIFAGRGFTLVATALKRVLPNPSALMARFAETGLFALTMAAPLAITVHSHPFGLSAYVPFVGGTRGGASLGLNRQFWGFTTESVAPYLDAKAARGATVYLHDTAWDAWQELAAEGRVRSDLRAVGSPSEADFALMHHELHMNEVDYQIWIATGTPAPSYVLTHDGVPIVSVYKRR